MSPPLSTILLLAITLLFTVSDSYQYCRTLSVRYQQFHPYPTNSFYQNYQIYNGKIWQYKSNLTVWRASQIILGNIKLFDTQFRYNGFIVLIVRNPPRDEIKYQIHNPNTQQSTIQIDIIHSTASHHPNGTYHGKHQQSMINFGWNGDVTVIGKMPAYGSFLTSTRRVTLIKGYNVLGLSKHLFVEGSIIGGLVYYVKITYLKCTTY